jgi:hypothetical protein
MKKFEEGVFSDLRNLKPGTDACLEEPKVSFCGVFIFVNLFLSVLFRSLFVDCALLCFVIFGDIVAWRTLASRRTRFHPPVNVHVHVLHHNAISGC